MKAVALDLCLALAVLAAWLGAAGFMRLHAALDRLHCTTFVLATTGPLLTLAALLGEGLTTRTVKLALLSATLLISGAATSHAVGRALLLRNGPKA